MPRINILSQGEINEYEKLPILSEQQWKDVFQLVINGSEYFDGLRNPVSKLTYVMQYGYFKYSKRFFPVSALGSGDLELVSSLLNHHHVPIHRTGESRNYLKQREYILEDFGHHAFKAREAQLERETQGLIAKRLKPKKIFQQVIAYLDVHRVERPSYDRIQKVITKGLNDFEQNLAVKINKHIGPEYRTSLNKLLVEVSQDSEHFPGAKSSILAQLKSPSQSIRASSIASSISDFEIIAEIYFTQLPLLEKLNISQDVIAYHASWTTKARYFQIQQFASDEKRYLHLLSFVCHQYKLRQDNFVEVFLRVVRSHHNYLAARKNEEVAKSAIKKDTLNKLSVSRNHYKSFCDKIIQIVNSQQHPEFQLDQIRLIADKETDRKKLREEELDRIQEQMDARLSDDQIYY